MKYLKFTQKQTLSTERRLYERDVPKEQWKMLLALKNDASRAAYIESSGLDDKLVDVQQSFGLPLFDDAHGFEVCQERAPIPKGLPTLHAKFTAQASIAGHLMDVDPEGADLVDITAECIEKGREWALSLGDEPDSLDHLKVSGGTPGWARDWPAPYRFDPPSDQEINHFFDEYEKALHLQERKRSSAECDGPSP